MKEEFPGWFGSQIRQRHVDKDLGVSASSELFTLACGPTPTPISVNSCVVNGVRFVVHSRDERRTTQNSGICSPGEDEEMYYGQLEQILEFSYMSFKTVLFRVKWFDTSNKGRVKHLVIRNNITQILENDDDPDIIHVDKSSDLALTTTLIDLGITALHINDSDDEDLVNVVDDDGVSVVYSNDDPDIIHVDKSSDLALTTTLNDLGITALHVNGQSIDVDAPPDIIDVDEDDAIIDDEDVLPHDLADSNDEDLVNVVDDDGMSADVVRGHEGDGDDDDRPHPHESAGGCRGKGTQKPNLRGRKAGRMHTRKETRNLGLRRITDELGPILLERKARMSADVVRGHEGDGDDDDRPHPHESAGGCRGKGTQKPNLRGRKAGRMHTRKETRNLGLRRITDELGPGIIGLRTPMTRLTTWKLSDPDVPQTSLWKIRMRISGFGLIPRTWPGVLKMLETEQRARSYADRDPGHLPPSEICRIPGDMSPGKSVHRGTRMVDRKPCGPVVVVGENCRGMNPRPTYPDIFSPETCRREKVSPETCPRGKLIFVPGDNGKCCSAC
nr:hypothetical protein [Tanacetum cinerariifolium]